MKIQTILTVACLAIAAMSHAQSPADSGPIFEVASVRPNKSGPGRDGIAVQPGGRFSAINMTLRDLIAIAYPVKNFFRGDTQLVGGPDWIGSDRFDIIAKAEGMPALDTNKAAAVATAADETAVEQVRLMLRKLLVDRFKVALHHEMRELPIYALVMAKTDRTLGPQLRQSDADCAAIWKSGQRLGPGEAPCGGVRGLGPGRIVARALTMEMLVDSLSRWSERTVIDRTGLTGKFDLSLTWAPNERGSQQADPSVPSIFTAVQEQLGLELESQRGPVEVLVIDHAERPTPD